MYYSAPQLSRHLLSSYPAAPTSSPISLYYWWSKSDSIQCNDTHLFFLPTFVLQCKKNLSFLLFLLIVLLSVLFNNSSPVVSEEGRVKRARREARLVIEGEKERERGSWVDKLVLFCDKKESWHYEMFIARPKWMKWDKKRWQNKGMRWSRNEKRGSITQTE